MLNTIKTGASKKKYIFNKSKAEEIYTKATELVPVFPKNEITKRIIRQAIAQLNSTSATVETIRILMNETASKLPEYPIVMQCLILLVAEFGCFVLIFMGALIADAAERFNGWIAGL